MTWAATPGADALAIAGRYEALQAFAIDVVETLATAAERLDEAAAVFSENGDVGTIQLAIEVRSIREQLIDLTEIYRVLLDRDVVEDLRARFASVGILEPEERKELAEKIAGHKIERLNELSVDEARALRAELESREDPF